jgi:hypothetical protein
MAQNISITAYQILPPSGSALKFSSVKTIGVPVAGTTFQPKVVAYNSIDPTIYSSVNAVVSVNSGFGIYTRYVTNSTVSALISAANA